MAERTSNYDLQIVAAKERFLQWDAGVIAERFHLKRDGEWLLVSFLRQTYRVSTVTGDIFLEDGGAEADFNAYLSIFDAICREKAGVLSGQWRTINDLGIHHPGVGEASLYAPYQSRFSGKGKELAGALRAMGVRDFPVGDVAGILDVFPFFPVVFQFWEGDEEFPAQLRILWDRNTLSFVRYETAWYIASALLERLAKLL